MFVLFCPKIVQMKPNAVAGFIEKGQKDKSFFHFVLRRRRKKKEKGCGPEEIKGKARAVPGFSLF